MFSGMINIVNRTDHRVDTEKLKTVATEFLMYYRRNGYSVTIALVDDQEIRRLNKLFLGREGVTDVLAFPGGKKELGEVVIDREQVQRQAREENNSEEYELCFVMVHGLLHLLGWEDYTPADKERMLEEGERFLRLKWEE